MRGEEGSPGRRECRAEALSHEHAWRVQNIVKTIVGIRLMGQPGGWCALSPGQVRGCRLSPVSRAEPWAPSSQPEGKDIDSLSLVQKYFFFLISSPGGKPQNLFCHVIPYLGLSFRNVTAEDWKLNCAGDVRDAAKRGFQRKPATWVSLLQQSLVSSL